MKLNQILFLLLFVSLVLSLNAENDILTVRSIKFEGNKIVSDRELLSQISTRKSYPYEAQTAIYDAEKISDYYLSKNILNAKVYYPEAIPVNLKELDLTYRIEEPEYESGINFKLSGNSYFSQERIFQFTGFKEQGDYPITAINTFMSQIVDLYASRAYLFASVSLDSLAITTDALNAYLNIEEGRLCKFNNFIFEGNEITTNQTLLRISGLDRMQTYSLNNLQQAEENVRRKEYIRDFQLIPLDSQSLLIKVTEDKMTYLSGLIGYDSTQKDGSARFSGFIDIRFLNLFGTDRSLAFNWRRMRQDRQSVEFRYHETGSFNLPVAADFELFRETADSTYIKTSVDTDIYYYSLRNKLGIYLGMDDIFPGSRRPKIYEKKSYKKIGAIWSYNSEDYLINPTKGIAFEARQFYILNKLRNKWQNKQATEIRWRNYIPLRTKLILSLSINGNQIQNKNLEDYELYSLGGAANLRGFREEQFIGYRTIWANTELRYLLTRRSRFYFFLDYGFVNQVTGKKMLNDLVGVGLGLKVDTGIGIIGIDYGLGHSNNNWTHPMDGMIHFGLETKF